MSDTLGSRTTWIWRAVLLLVWLYLFVVAINLIGHGFKSLGGDFARMLIETVSDPFTGLFIGVLATALVQSSSTTTTLVVSLASAGGLTLGMAIPMIMGANVGTSITNTIVSMGHIRRREEFQRAFAASTVHDMFNLLAIGVLFPLELATGYLRELSLLLGDILIGVGGLEVASPATVLVKPVVKWIAAVLGGNGWLVIAVGLVVLVFSLSRLVKLMKTVVLGRVEQFFTRTIFRNAGRALLLGLVLTVLVQSSSITTSVVVPLAGAGILTLAQIYPFTLGANVGTTVTAWLAALSLGNPVGLTVALAHLLFNLSGMAIFWPLRFLPMRMAEVLANSAVRNRVIPFLYLVIVFFLIPLAVYWLH